MPYIHITAEAHAAIRRLSIGEFQDNSVRKTDGSLAVPVSDKTLDRLRAARHPGETYSDIILRLAALASSCGRVN